MKAGDDSVAGGAAELLSAASETQQTGGQAYHVGASQSCRRRLQHAGSFAASRALSGGLVLRTLPRRAGPGSRGKRKRRDSSLAAVSGGAGPCDHCGRCAAPAARARKSGPPGRKY